MTISRDRLPSGPNSPAVWQLLKYSHSPLLFLEQCSARFGDPFTVRLAGYGRFVMLSSPEAVRDVFLADSHVLHSGEGNEFLIPTVGEASVLVLDDDRHVRQRQLLLPPLKGERMRGYFDIVREETLVESATWPRGIPMPMIEPMQRITLNLMSRIVLGPQSPEDMREFARLVGRVLAFGRHRYALIGAALVPRRAFRNATFLPFFRQLRQLDEAIFRVIADFRLRAPFDRPPCVLTDLLAASAPDGAPMSDREIRDAIVTMLVAGHDTTSIALCWALDQIEAHADVAARVMSELRDVIGQDQMRVEQLDALSFLEASIRETLRRRTMFPFVVRLTKRPFVAAGIEYPQGVVLCPCSHLVHRRPDIYAEPAEFRPERFLGRRFAGHEFFPFGGGVRSCVGMALAMFEMKIVLATLLGRFRFQRPKGARSCSVRRGIALAPHDGAVMSVLPWN